MTTSIEETNKAIETETNRIISATLQKHGITLDQLKQQCPGAVEDAQRVAKDGVEKAQALEANPVYAQLEAEREAHRLTQMALEASRQIRPNNTNVASPTLDPTIVRAKLGEREYWALTDDGRLAAIGVAPGTVTRVDHENIKALFGKHTSSAFASNYQKQSPTDYKRLRAIATVLDLKGK
jgi:hypothetical protein